MTFYSFIAREEQKKQFELENRFRNHFGHILNWKHQIDGDIWINFGRNNALVCVVRGSARIDVYTPQIVSSVAANRERKKTPMNKKSGKRTRKSKSCLNTSTIGNDTIAFYFHRIYGIGYALSCSLTAERKTGLNFIRNSSLCLTFFMCDFCFIFSIVFCVIPLFEFCSDSGHLCVTMWRCSFVIWPLNYFFFTFTNIHCKADRVGNKSTHMRCRAAETLSQLEMTRWLCISWKLWSHRGWWF